MLNLPRVLVSSCICLLMAGCPAQGSSGQNNQNSGQNGGPNDDQNGGHNGGIDQPFDQPPTRSAGWRHKRTKLATKLGSARHSAVDAIVNPGMPAAVHGKFAYGKVSKDLEDEEVWLQLSRPDGTWQALDKALTDSDGRVTLYVPDKYLTQPGAHAYRLLVSGDLSEAQGMVWVLERAQKAVIFDIDGTLTTGDSELIDDAFGGDIDVRRGAADVVRYWHDAGYTVLFLTGRPYMYNRSTRNWLKQHGFPNGPMATANTMAEAVPSKNGVGAFKRSWLLALKDSAGVDIVAAYGNAATDICAFAQAGISPASTYIIDNSQRSCDGYDPVNLIDDYVSHIDSLKQR